MSHKVKRTINLQSLLKKKSYILLGPRQTGKSFLIREELKSAKKYNLLLAEDYRKLSFDITAIRKEYKPEYKIIVIDEFQRLPELLDEVHYMIEEYDVRFLLTGSSARKLKKDNLNLLGGRARFAYLHPFTFNELGDLFDLNRAVNYGLIPGLYFSEEPDKDLDAYLASYVELEIAREGLVRSLPSFTRFLEVAALSQAEQVDFTSISNDTQIPRTTIHEYFKIIEDTLLGYMLPTWKQAKKRKPIATSKFYFFDWAIPKKLQGIKNITEKSTVFGKAFESYIFHELKTYCDYNNTELHYWRTRDQHEVDFILNHKIAIEVKASHQFKKEYVKSLAKIKEEDSLEQFYIIYLGPDLKLDEFKWIKVLNYQNFLSLLYKGQILT